jgi:uncharacterized protein (TIGR03382 family)
MKPLSQLLVASQILILAAPAFANPYAREVLRAREVPGTSGQSNVQLTYGVDGKTPQAPTDVVTFGTKTTPWKLAASGYNTNTGSGVRYVSAIQMCDCGVTIGQSLEYKITGVSAYSSTSELSLTARLTTTGVYPTATPDSSTDDGLDAGEEPDVLPWNVPDPVEIQGLDCTAECVAVAPSGTGGAQGTGGATGVDGAQAAGGGNGTSTTAASGGAPGSGGAQAAGGVAATTTGPGNRTSSGCSLAQGHGPAGLFPVIAAVGLAVLGRRKRAR